MLGRPSSSRLIAVGVLVVASCFVLLPTRTVSGRVSDDANGQVARGAGTTIIQGGTGSPDFIPVLTTLAFHAERQGGIVTGAFECLARAPENSTGSGSAQFTVNAMYVVGTVVGATVSRDTATLTGHASITGLGLGTNVPFTFAVRRGGPGSTAVLTVNTLPALPFHEVLLDGNFEIFAGN